MMIPKKRKRYPGDIPIDYEDIKLIMGSDFEYFSLIVNKAFCAMCPEHTTTIINYQPYLTKNSDIVLEGYCKKCGGPVNRLIETGESKANTAVANHIRTVIKKYKVH